jgi:predicted lipase
VYTYFLKAYKSLMADIKTTIQPYTANDTKFLVTGHSLGGSLAALCALDLTVGGYVSTPNMLLYTFGEPRVGDPSFAAAMDKYVTNSYRVVHYEDIVPHLPFADGGLITYLHHSTEIWYNEDFTKFTNCGPDENADCSDSTSVLSWNVPDHLEYFNYGIAGDCS